MPSKEPERNASTVRRWRARNPEKAAQQAFDAKVRDKALRELGRRHQTELDELITRVKRQMILDGKGPKESGQQ